MLLLFLVEEYILANDCIYYTFFFLRQFTSQNVSTEFPQHKLARTQKIVTDIGNL